MSINQRSTSQFVLFDIWLLLKKDLRIQFRHRVVTFFELIVPCSLVLLVALLRTKVTVTEYNDPTIFDEFNLAERPKILQNDKFRNFQIYFTPKNNQTINIMNNLIDDIDDQLTKNSIYNGDFFGKFTSESIGFENSEDMVDSYLQANDSVLCGIEFDWPLTETKIGFTLRFSNLPRTIKVNPMKIQDWKTQLVMKNVMPSGPRAKIDTHGGPPGYADEGFLFIQHFLTMTIAKTLFGEKTYGHNDKIEIELYGQRFPYPPYIDDVFLFSMNFLFPTIFMFSFYFSAINLTKTIVNEKEKRMKESMKMMGLKEKYHFIAYFIKSIILMVPAIVLIIIFLKIRFLKSSPPILISDSTILFIYFLLYHICNTCFSFMLSTFFSKANVAGIVTGILSFLSYMPYFPMIQQYNTYTMVSKILTCLLPNTNMSFGAFIMLIRETRGIPVSWSNIADPAIPNDDLTFLVILMMFIVNSLIYLIVTWYMTLAFPGEYGVPLVWYFPITKNYWLPSDHDYTSDYSDNIDYNKNNNANIEAYPKNLKVGISIRNLSKTYDNGKTYSVKNLSFNVFENQITALLGHNGAGKTTTISLLCGLFPPSDGTAIVNGYDVREEMNQIRSSLGICPQSNLLFDELTVEEHLDFYCRLKHTNLSDDEIRDEIKEMVEKLDLQDKFKVSASKLSGGMKRKLSVGIALIGGSKIVILDEPTSGMDVSARRFIWDLLLKEKYGRSIIISTHFMEEADILGDRIAIMDSGSLRCYGSPLFLKKHFGAGYHLRMEKRSVNVDTGSITKIINEFVNDAKLESSVGIEIIYSLPSDQTSQFGPLLRFIENDLKEDIVTYGISITTMEEVFLKVGSHNQLKTKSLTDEQNLKSHTQIDITNLANDNQELKLKNIGTKLMAQQFYALSVKRLLYSYRKPLLTILQFLLPIIILIATLLMMKSIPQLSPFRKLKMSLEQFANPFVKYFVSNNPSSIALSLDYANILKDENIGSNNIKAIYDTDQHKIVNEITSVNNFVYNYEYVISSLFEYANDSKLELKAVAMFNDQPYHTPSISLKYVDQALIRHLYNLSDLQLSVSNYPMPLTFREKLNKFKSPVNFQGDFQVSQALIMGLSFFLSSFALLIVEERVVKAKHLQKITGLRMTFYWLSFLIYDFLFYLVSIVLIIITLLSFKVDNLHDSEQMFYLFVGYALDGFALLPFVYSASFLFTVPATAYARLSLLLILSGIGSMIIDQLTLIKEFGLTNVNEALKPIFHLFIPLFDISKITSNLQTNYRNNKICNTLIKGKPLQYYCQFLKYSTDERLNAIKPCCPDYCDEVCLKFEKNYLSLKEPGIGLTLIYIIGSSLIYWLLLISIETNIIATIKNIIELLNRKYQNEILKKKSKDYFDNKVDDDVLAEKSFVDRIVATNQQKQYSLLINNLTKKYGKFTAVDNISYCVKYGECFGLLGINGAGKTTTFKMITGDETITAGDIFINGSNVLTDPYETLGRIGYCPQFDALIDNMTGEETLRFYSRLRGIKEEDIDAQIDELSKLLYFEMHLKKLTMNYSGGNKRKLSTAIAMLGNPTVTFLDEPTSGVDPVARRCLWEAIGKKLKQNLSIVLTSHSMEECEALCNRLIIMVNGEIKCIGSPLHLKTKFGNSYNLTLKLALECRQSSSFSSTSSISLRRKSLSELDKHIHQVKKFISKKFPTSQLKAIHNNQIEYIIKNENDYKIYCSEIFTVIESNKDKLHLEDYSVSQTNLEQIFLSFAREQRESLSDQNSNTDEFSDEKSTTSL